jgi:predicted transcriptional regulator of viral defense system
MKEKTTDLLRQAIEKSPGQLARLDVLRSLRLCDDATLNTLLSRLGREGRILRLKRGLYSANPVQDPFLAAQALFGGYLGYTSALYLHGLIAEVPFEVLVVTQRKSAQKTVGVYSFRAISMGPRAIGFQTKGPYTLSTPAKTLYDCLRLPSYSVELDKLLDAYASRGLSHKERAEFNDYVKTLGRPRVPPEAKRRLRKLGVWS